MSRRLGFVSPAGVLVAALALLGVLAWTLAKGPVLFSPGPLNAQVRAQPLGGVTSHAQLAGDCGACHAAPWNSQTMADRCLACHADVEAQIQARNGLHGGLVEARSSPTCRGCHPEHHGAAGALTVVDGANFPHDLTGYSLSSHRRTAKGARVTCTECHPKDLAHFDQATCTECHAALDATFMSRHEATFGKQCLPCHDGSGRAGANFDHNTLPFKLTGKHAGLPCEQCHAKAGSLQALQKTPQDCRSCHAKDDKHRGAFGQQCGQCHSAAGWDQVTFDHAVFPLDHGSEERTPTCQTCHPTDVSAYTCYGCHEHTPARVQAQHEGRAATELTDCIRCHQGGRSEGGD